MKQRASSGQTFLYKYIYTGIVIGGAGWCGLMDDCACLPVLFWLPVLAIFFYKTTGSLKKVEYDRTSLYISDYVTAVKIEKKNICSVISGRFFFSGTDLARFPETCQIRGQSHVHAAGAV